MTNTLVGGFRYGEMVVLSTQTKRKTSNQEIAFFMAWNYAKVGKKVRLSKENGVWSVIIKT